MNTFKYILASVAAAAALAAAVPSLVPVAHATETEMTMPQSAAEHAAAAEKYEQEARELETKAERHARMAKHYGSRSSGGTKGAEGVRSLILHCERLAKSYREAAEAARAMAQTHRQMAQPA